MKKIFLFLFCFTAYTLLFAQTKKFRVGLEFGMTLSSISYENMLFKRWTNNTTWQVSELETGTFQGELLAPAYALGVNTEWRISRFFALQNGFTLFGRILKEPLENTTISYYGLTTLAKVLPFRKLPNLYFLAGARYDKMLDYSYSPGRAFRILNYSEKENELSPIIGIGYELKSLPIFILSVDVRYNQGFKNLLRGAPWQTSLGQPVTAYNQTFWLNFNFWFRRKGKSDF